MKMPGELAMEQTQEAPAEAEKKEPPASKPMVGIIYPPPEVRSIQTHKVILADKIAENTIGAWANTIGSWANTTGSCANITSSWGCMQGKG